MQTGLVGEYSESRGGVAEVAGAVGVNQSQYSRVESGKRRPSPDLAKRLADYFGNEVTRDQILFPELYPMPPKRTPRSAQLQKAS